MNFWAKHDQLSPFSISIGNQDQMLSCTELYHKGKRSDRNHLFVHHCKTFPNPFKRCYDFWPNLFRSFPQEAVASHVVITRMMSWTQSERITQMSGEMNCVLAQGKCGFHWNYGKNDEESGFTLISRFLTIGRRPKRSVVNARPCGCVSYDKSTFLLASDKKQTERVWDNGRGRMQSAVACQNNQRGALAFLTFH